MKIAVASGKGGVGKSMLASSLAILFAKDRQVVAVDCDVDAPNLHLWLGENEGWDQTEKISTNEKAIIDHKKCNLCGKCVDICAFGALSTNDQPFDSASLDYARDRQGRLTVNNFFCEGCGACEAICPQKAIRLVPIENAEIRIKKIYLNIRHPDPESSGEGSQ